MSRERSIDRRSEYPKLSDVDHHEHDQARLPHSSVMTLGRPL